METKTVVTGDDFGRAVKVNPITKRVDVIVDNETIEVNALNQLTVKPQPSTVCKLNVKAVTGNHTVNARADEVLLVDGGIVTLPADVEVGQQFTVVQYGQAEVTIASGGTTIAPFQGSLTLAGENAVVTVLCVATNTFRVFGQTKGA